MKLLRGICSKSHFDLILKLQSCSKFEHEILELIKDISLFNTSFRKFNVIPYHVLFHQISILSCQVKWSQTSAKLQPDNWIFSQFGLVGWILLDIYSQTLPCSWSLRKISAPLLWRKNSSRGGCNQEWGTNGSLRLDAFKVYLGLGKCRPGE